MSNHLTHFMALVSKLPLPLLQSLGSSFARLFYLTSKAKILHCAKLNLQIALADLSEQQHLELSKQATINELQSYFEFLSIWGSSTQKNLSRIHSVTGEQYFLQALAEKKGAVLIIPHFGTWEIMNPWLSQHTTLTIMYKPVKNKAADAFVKNARTREHANLVPTDESGVKQIFRALKQGGVTVILPDHSPDHPSECVNWFDVPLYSSQLSAKLIQKTKAAALFLYAIRNAQGGFDITIEPMDEQIYQPNMGTCIIHKKVEQLIRRYPEHYHWSYKRFKASAETNQLYNIPHNQALKLARTIQQRQLDRRQ